MKKIGQYCIVLAFFKVLPSLSNARDDVYIAPHNGQYNLELHKINNTTLGIVNASGTLSYNLTQDCTGWIAHTSIYLDLNYENGTSSSVISNLSSYESFDGWHYSFAFQNYNETAEPLVFTGNVSFPHGKDYAIANYREPKEQPPINLPLSTLFPVSLYKNIIRAGYQNIAHFTAPYFDGSSPTELFDTSVFITAVKKSDNLSIEGDTSIINHLPIIETSLAFFSENNNKLPHFESRFTIFSNGVLKEMIQTLGPIDVKVKLAEIKDIPPKVCAIK